jgi:RNA polymerase sigma-70 factor (ECF subfamily)
LIVIPGEERRGDKCEVDNEVAMMKSEFVMEQEQGNVADEVVTALFEQHHRAIFGYLYRLVNDAAWAEDLTQETFLQLYRTRKQLLNVENRRAWVYRLASNLAFNALKRRRRFRWLPWHDGEWQQAPVASDAGMVERFHLQKRVNEALSSLSPSYRAPLLLYSHYGFSVREVAEALELSEGAVKTRLYRAREMFREAYGPPDVAQPTASDHDERDTARDAARRQRDDERENER